MVTYDPCSYSLYFHVPFCKKKCDYCHFFVLPDKDDLKEILLAAFKKEWQQVIDKVKKRKLISIYFGGGTPSLFGPARIQQILSWIAKSIDLSAVEITLELNPETCSPAIMRHYREIGINRVSIGVQSLDDTELTMLTRQHNSIRAVEAIDHTYNAGISNISIDLMYDLPGQTHAKWIETIKKAASLPITHLSLYNLTIEPHTVFYKYKEKLSKKIPSEATSLHMYESAIEGLKECGLLQYEISAFAKDGMISKHNTGYWIGRPFLGLGPSAYSYWDNERFRNVAHLNKYAKALNNGISPIDYRDSLSSNERRKELFVIGMRLMQGIDIKEFEKQHGLLDEEFKETLLSLKSHGLIQQQDAHFSLTQRGIHLYDSVATELI